MVRSSQVSPLDIQIKKRPADIFIPHLPNPTHYPFLSSVFYLHFSPPRWGEESGNGHEIPQPPAFMCLAVLTEDLGDLSLFYVTVPFMACIDHQGVQPLSHQVHYCQGIFHPPPPLTRIERHLIHISFSVHTGKKNQNKQTNPRWPYLHGAWNLEIFFFHTVFPLIWTLCLHYPRYNRIERWWYSSGKN